MLLFSALVAGSFSLGALAADEISPTALNAARFAIAAALIAVAALATTGLPRSAFRAPWRYLVLGGLFSIYFVTMFEGLKTAPPVSSAAVFTLTPLIAAGFGWMLERQRMTGRIALALAIGAAGALWVIFRADIGALLAFEIGRGEEIFFWGCVAHAAYTPMVPRLNRGEPPVVFTFGTLLASCLLLFVYGWTDIMATDWAALPAIVWITLIYVATIGAAVTFVLVQYAAMRLPASKVMAYTYLVPTWVIGWEVALGQPMPPLLVMAGVGLTVLALVLLVEGD
ncbi:EamA-like transporter family protein [Tropicimonas sediminicola]|uniref:EamA-like transporter family protein n=2 Tax=Tropicimonas sediminicola TaxID=1031541 RepID=A0A239CKI2_9RHOB|nr:DMT family transporter [Tropicimonas sediminicola]SNS20685.1 EamA-like transporter family protein [Tropicimonas sediminicola]